MFLADDTDTALKRNQRPKRAIRRSIVYDDHFHVFVILPQHGLYRGRNVRLAVMDRNDDAYLNQCANLLPVDLSEKRSQSAVNGGSATQRTVDYS